MILDWFRDKTPDTAYSAYTALVGQARQPAFYRNCAVPDTVDGRFDLIVMHVVLVFRRLRQGDNASRAFGQHIFDIFIKDMDRSLREIGIGDVSIPKKMKKIGESYFGRSEAYEAALESGDLDALAAAVDRNIFTDDDNAAGSRALADYIFAADALLMGQETDILMTGNIVWPDVEPG